MPIQTVEEAAQLFHDNICGKATNNTPLREYTEKNRELEYGIAFKAGAAWQKEQGIDWIKVGIIHPDITHSLNNETSYSSPALVTNGSEVQIGTALFTTNGFFIRWLGSYINVTHWAKITLPKTDK